MASNLSTIVIKLIKMMQRTASTKAIRISKWICGKSYFVIQGDGSTEFARKVITIDTIFWILANHRVKTGRTVKGVGAVDKREKVRSLVAKNAKRRNSTLLIDERRKY
jgi:hypothetical protein